MDQRIATDPTFLEVGMKIYVGLPLLLQFIEGSLLQAGPGPSPGRQFRITLLYVGLGLKPMAQVS